MYFLTVVLVCYNVISMVCVYRCILVLVIFGIHDKQTFFLLPNKTILFIKWFQT